MRLARPELDGVGVRAQADANVPAMCAQKLSRSRAVIPQIE
jgi:hypothetical protein